MAHITGGGIEGNLRRIIPDGLRAEIDLAAIKPPTVFRTIRERGNVEDADMLRTFNLGAGLVMVVAPDLLERAQAHLTGHGYESVVIGEIGASEDAAAGKVAFAGTIGWA
jgi:phosphoribosylformylglycinamidine cyclo-ligase